MRKERFKDIFLFAPKSKIKAGEGLQKGRFPFYTSSQHLTKWINTEQHFDEALIFGTGGSANIHYVNEPFSTSTDCIVAINRKDEIKTKFVYYYLFSNIHILERGFKGAGLMHISKEYIENIEISLPDFETQNKIIAILDNVKAVLDKREITIAFYDNLLRNTFIDFFGDPYLNPRKWDKRSIQSICKNIVDCPHTTPDYLEIKSDYPCIRTSEIKNGEINWDSMKYISEDSYFKRISRLKPDENDIIFGREGTVGEALLIPNNLNISLGQRVMLFRVNDEIVNPIFFWAQIVSNAIQFEIKRKTIGATVKRINISDLIKINFVIPPIELQNKFASSIKNIFNLKEKIKLHQDKSNTLLKSLTQQVFSERIIVDIDTELDSLINGIDLDKKDEENKIDTILNDITYIQRLMDKLRNHEFEKISQYDKASYILLRIMKEEEGIIKQLFKDNEIQITLQNEIT